MAADDLIDRYCAVWNEPQPDSRATALAAVWAEGGIYSDPTVEAHGAAALLAHIAETRGALGAFVIERVSAVDHHHGSARFAWRAVRGDGSVLVEGGDFVVFGDGGARIARITGFFGPLDRAGHAV